MKRELCCSRFYFFSQNEKLKMKEIYTRGEKYSLNKIAKRVRSSVGNAIVDFNMIEDGDTIMVCLSGGKDSYIMLDMLLSLQKSAPISYKLVVVNLDQKLPNYPYDILDKYLKDLGVVYKIVQEDTFSIVKEKITNNKSNCSLCSRLRRGILYKTAKELGIRKIALGHHREDILETFFLNMFYGGKLKAMPPKYKTDDGEHIIIRPLSYCKEKDLIKYSEFKQYPIIPANLCGFSVDNSQRATIKNLIDEWDNKYPGRVETMFRAMFNVVPSHLADKNLFNFIDL